MDQAIPLPQGKAAKAANEEMVSQSPEESARGIYHNAAGCGVVEEESRG